MKEKLNNLLLEEMVNGMKLTHQTGGKVDIMFTNPFGAEMKATTFVSEGYVKTVSHPYRDPKSAFEWYVIINNRTVKFGA